MATEAEIVVGGELHDLPTVGQRRADAVGTEGSDLAPAVLGPSAQAGDRLASMLIGELNGSHMGFTPVERTPRAGDWTPVTGHPGVRFDPSFPGPGLRVKEVLPGSPADRDITRLYPDDIVLTIDGQSVDAKFDLTRVLNGPMPREVLIAVTNAAGRREFRLPLTDPDRSREFAKEEVQKIARLRVAAWSGGRLGYIDIEKMQVEDLREFEKKVPKIAYVTRL